MSSRPSPLRTWLQLFRAPNLLTVPGDPLAGYLLASFAAFEPQVWSAVGASLCFYSGGLLLNDLADLREDRRERPERPLPSGAAWPGAVALVLAILFAAGLYLSWKINLTGFATGGALLASIVIYNFFTKRVAVLGALNMGICRGLSMLLGATAVPHGELTYRLVAYGRLDHLVTAVLLLTLYIAAVTNLARWETKAKVPAFAKWLPAAVLITGSICFLSRLVPSARAIFAELGLQGIVPLLLCVLLFILVCAFGLQTAARLLQQPPPLIPPQIGTLIRLLLLLQAGFCAATVGIAGSPAAGLFGEAGGSLTAGLLVCCWPLSRALSRRFYAS